MRKTMKVIVILLCLTFLLTGAISAAGLEFHGWARGDLRWTPENDWDSQVQWWLYGDINVKGTTSFYVRVVPNWHPQVVIPNTGADAGSGIVWGDGSLDWRLADWKVTNEGSLWYGGQPVILTIGQLDARLSPYTVWRKEGYDWGRWEKPGIDANSPLNMWGASLQGIQLVNKPSFGMGLDYFFGFEKAYTNRVSALKVFGEVLDVDYTVSALVRKEYDPADKISTDKEFVVALEVSTERFRDYQISGVVASLTKPFEAMAVKADVKYIGFDSFTIDAGIRDFDTDYTTSYRSLAVGNPIDTYKDQRGFSIGVTTSIVDGYTFGVSYDRWNRKSDDEYIKETTVFSVDTRIQDMKINAVIKDADETVALKSLTSVSAGVDKPLASTADYTLDGWLKLDADDSLGNVFTNEVGAKIVLQKGALKGLAATGKLVHKAGSIIESSTKYQVVVDYKTPSGIEVFYRWSDPNNSDDVNKDRFGDPNVFDNMFQIRYRVGF